LLLKNDKNPEKMLSSFCIEVALKEALELRASFYLYSAGSSYFAMRSKIT